MARPMRMQAGAGTARRISGADLRRHHQDPALLEHAELLPVLKRNRLPVHHLGDRIGGRPDAGHPRQEPHQTPISAARWQLTRAAGIALAPTFVPFTPWTTLEGYIALLARLVELELVESVPPIQLAIRLLVPAGSELLQLPGFMDHLGAFDPKLLGYPWAHADARVDALQQDIQAWVAEAEQAGLSRRDVSRASGAWRMPRPGEPRRRSPATRVADPASVGAVVLLRRADRSAVAELLTVSMR